MKKYLVTLALICLLALLPNNVYSLDSVDEEGKIITGETQDGEYNLLVAPDTGGQDGNSSSTDTVTPEDKVLSSDENDKSVSSNDNSIDSSNGYNQDEIYATGVQEDAELLVSKEEDNKNNDTLIMVISSIIGLSVGSVGMYLFLIKRK